jgi:hypothetical protein
VPLTFELGEAFQFDWSEEPLVIGGIYRRLQVAHMKLCASRAFWLVAYPSQGHEMLFDAHTRSFAALGGVAPGHLRQHEDGRSTSEGQGRDVNARFAACARTTCSTRILQRVASGWEKGVVEKNVQDSRRRIWLAAREQRFGSLEELNAWLGERCKALWAELRHPEHKAFSVAEMLELERSHLMPKPVDFDGYVQDVAAREQHLPGHRRATATRCRASWAADGQHAAVPAARGDRGRRRVVATRAASAARAARPTTGSTTCRWSSASPALRNGAPSWTCPEPLARLRQALLRHAGGDRLMAQVLALSSTAGLDEVLVAAELALERRPRRADQPGARGQRAGAAHGARATAQRRHATEHEHTAAGRPGRYDRPAPPGRAGGRPWLMSLQS